MGFAWSDNDNVELKLTAQLTLHEQLNSSLFPLKNMKSYIHLCSCLKEA